MEMKLELVAIPVTDVDRAKSFMYKRDLPRTMTRE